MSDTLPIKRPVMGVLLDPAMADRVPLQRPGWELSLFADAADEAGIMFYYFALRGIDLEHLKVTGWLRVNGEWQQQIVPWPEVFYDQARMAGSAEANRLNYLYEGSIPINSVRTLGKWACYDCLRRSAPTSLMLPEAVLYRRPDDLLTMLARHPSLFIKPEWGSNGQGIARVWASGDGSWGWRDALGDEAELNLTPEAIIERVNQASSRSPLIIQREIPLFEIDSRRTDIRVGMRKDGQGQWMFEESRIRIAKPGAITTNFKRGSSWVRFPEGLGLLRAREEEASALWARLQEAALAVAHQLEDCLGHLGELGLDLGFDQGMRLWFIEANVMPNKSTYPTVNGVIDPVYTRTIAYAVHLYQEWGSRLEP